MASEGAVDLMEWFSSGLMGYNGTSLTPSEPKIVSNTTVNRSGKAP